MELDGWGEFFVASAGAAAALAGLVAVAVSVNIERILRYRQLPARAGAAVATFVLALVVSLVCLAQQSSLALGVELIAFGGLAWLLHVHATRISLRSDEENRRPRHEGILELIRGQAQSLPFIAAGILSCAGVGSGIFVVLAGLLAAFTMSMYEAWVLLVEILR